MNANQHAFQKDRSTGLVLSDMVDYFKSEVLKGGFAIGTFLDIQDTFNNLHPDSVLESLGRWGTPAK
jgi:hypothetical protein